jgi:hypothetical protein
MSGRTPKAKQVAPQRHAVTVIDTLDTPQGTLHLGCTESRVPGRILNILRVGLGVFDLPVYPLTGLHQRTLP